MVDLCSLQAEPAATVSSPLDEPVEESLFVPAAKKAKGADPAAEWAQWKEGESVPYSFVAQVIASTFYTFCQLVCSGSGLSERW